jgi:hypothetical protein
LFSFAPPTPDAVPIWFVAAGERERVKGAIGAPAAAFAERCGFKPRAAGSRTRAGFYLRACRET